GGLLAEVHEVEEDQRPDDRADDPGRMKASRPTTNQDSIARSAFSAASTCCAAWNCELKTWRTVPSRSITYVTRPGRTPSVDGTPYSFRTAPPRSDSRTNGRRYLVANFSCDSEESELTPITSAPASWKSWYWSRKVHDSFVHPGVSRSEE